MEKALITGCAGQDGNYLARYLSGLGYEVHGIVRRHNGNRIPPVNIIEGDITDAGFIDGLVKEIRPTEIYNLAAQTHVGESFKIPHATFEVNANGALNILEAARRWGGKVYQASTSELFGIECSPQNEDTPFHPRSPYGISKLAAYWSTINYRESYNLHASNGILFNHESPLRGDDFVTQKVVKGAVNILIGRQEKLFLGNMDAKRDWGHAHDYVRAMHLILQNKPGEYVVATGESHSVREMVEYVFNYLELDYKKYVEIDPKLYRPSEVPDLKGDPSKIKSLGWKPNYTFESLMGEMINAALRTANRHTPIRETFIRLGNRHMERG